MTDADEQRIKQIQAKLRRINGNKELSPKQFETSCALVREIWALEGSPSIDEIFSKE